jgi:acyl-CoA synthetase (NDP forming)
MAALGVACRYGRIRSAPPALAARPAGLDVDAAQLIVRRALAEGREWLDADEAHALLRAYGLPVCPQVSVDDVGMAVAAANRFGYPVAVKLGRAGLHKSELGGVRLDLAHAGALRDAVAALRRIDDGPLVVQPMLAPGTELIVGSVRDPQCGPLVMVGMGGVTTDVLGDRSFALAPLPPSEAARMIDELRSAALLDGYRGAPTVRRDAIAEVIVRVGAMADDLAEIAELDLNPLLGTADGVMIVDARIRVTTPPARPDPLVRQLRSQDAPRNP